MKRYLKKLAPTLITCMIFFAPDFCNAQIENNTGTVDQFTSDIKRAIEILNEELETANEEIEKLSWKLQYLKLKLATPTSGEDVSTISDITEMMTFELQMMMSKQQQLLQLLSNMMKTYHDTQKSIIENMR